MPCFLPGALLLFLSPALIATAQAQAAPRTEQPASDFYSGVITAVAPDKITVFKTVLGKSSETRTFLITKETRVEGKLKMKVRVTVRYAHEDDGDRALHIIVRASPKK